MNPLYYYQLYHGSYYEFPYRHSMVASEDLSVYWPRIPLSQIHRCAEEGFWRAQVELGRIYHQGHRVEADPKEAFKWLKEAADQGSVVAMDLLGNRHFGIYAPLQRVSLRKDAAMKGYPVAQANLGLSFLYGQDVSVDYDNAYEWFELAANSQNPCALFALIKMHEEQVHPKPDSVDIETLKEKASQISNHLDRRHIHFYAEHGDIEHQFLLGCLYQEGKLLPQNLQKAHRWFQAASMNITPPAKDFLAEELPPEEIRRLALAMLSP